MVYNLEIFADFIGSRISNFNVIYNVGKGKYVFPFSLAGCPEAAVSNIMSAATNAEGALGLVICDWTGKGHLNHQPFSWPGILAAAGLAWNKNTPKVKIVKIDPLCVLFFYVG